MSAAQRLALESAEAGKAAATRQVEALMVQLEASRGGAQEEKQVLVQRAVEEAKKARELAAALELAEGEVEADGEEGEEGDTDGNSDEEEEEEEEEGGAGASSSIRVGGGGAPRRRGRGWLAAKGAQRILEGRGALVLVEVAVQQRPAAAS